MIRKAGQHDAEAIDAFLAQHAATSMFLRGNLASHGVGQGEHPHSTDYFLWEDQDLAAVFAMTKRGFLLAQAPGAPQAAFEGFAGAIAGRQALGMTGVKTQVDQVLKACGITDSFSLYRQEPLYRLSLDDLSDPKVEMRAATTEDAPLLSQWFRDDMIETETVPGGQDPADAGRARAKEAPGGSLRFLIEDGQPVAMAALNAQVGEMVQLSSVYVPPDLRRKGRAARVVAGLLAEARDCGIKTAILFAASEAAASVYERIGFRLIGQYQIALLAEPQVITAKAGSPRSMRKGGQTP